MQFSTMKEELNFLKKRYQLIQQLETIVNLKNYIRVEPDYFESYERFIKMNERISKENMIKVLQNDGQVMLLRPDITTNIIKQVTPKWNDGDVLRLFYLATTFSQKQGTPIIEEKNFGVELLGHGFEAEVEIMDIITTIFESLNLNFILEIGNQKFLNILFEGLALSPKQITAVKEALESKNRLLLHELIAPLNLSVYKDVLLKIFDLEGSYKEILEKLKPLELPKNLRDSLNVFRLIQQNLSKKQMSNQIVFDLSLVSKFDYYEGITFKGYIEDVSDAVLSGGRYDPLTEAFSKRMPAIGFSLSLSILIRKVLLT